MRSDRSHRCVRTLPLVLSTALVLAATLSWPRPARADIQVDLEPYIILAAIVAAEVFVPDTWVELDVATGEPSAEMSWPLAVTLGRFSVPDGWIGFVVHGLAELHYNSACGAVRGVFGGRFTVLPLSTPFGLYAEGGYVGGQDGRGSMAGGGLVYELLPDLVSVMAGYRASMLDDETGRHSFGLNLELAAPLNWLYQDGRL